MAAESRYGKKSNSITRKSGTNTALKISPADIFLWTFRRNERDTVNLYGSLSDVMRLATGGDMLNFGYWDGDSAPILAQQRLCSRFGDLAKLSSGQEVLDVGSGYGAPAAQWRAEHPEISILSVNLSLDQLADSAPGHRINATAAALPVKPSSMDRILAFESAQHFRPLSSFLSESFRSLKRGGYLALAMPVMAGNAHARLTNLGLLSLTWSSERYAEDFVLSSARDSGFEIDRVDRIGSSVYSPLADYYERNRAAIRRSILRSYPGYVESVLFASIKKMRDVSEKKIIDYVLVLCKKPTRF